MYARRRRLVNRAFGGWRFNPGRSGRHLGLGPAAAGDGIGYLRAAPVPGDRGEELLALERQKARRASGPHRRGEEIVRDYVLSDAPVEALRRWIEDKNPRDTTRCPRVPTGRLLGRCTSSSTG
jgi:hypothetical protein